MIHTKHTMNNPDALASALDANVNAMIIALNSLQLTEVKKKKLEALLNEERNNVTTVLKSLGSIQEMLKLMEKQEMNDGWWIDMVELVRQNKRISTIKAHVKLASIKAIINKIRIMYNLVWTQTPPLLSTPLLPVPPLQTPSPSVPPLRCSLSSPLEYNIKKWKLTLDQVKEYIDKNNKKQSGRDENNKIKKQGKWIDQQKTNYKYKIRNMKYKIYRKLWEDFINDNKYKEHFHSNKEEWEIKLEWVKKYINEYKKRPSVADKDKNVKKLGVWISRQKENYKNRQKNMSNKNIRHLWEDFFNEYEIYFN